MFIDFAISKFGCVQRQKFVELNDKIHMLSSSFQQGVASISSLPRSQLPGDMQHMYVCFVAIIIHILISFLDYLWLGTQGEDLFRFC